MKELINILIKKLKEEKGTISIFVIFILTISIVLTSIVFEYSKSKEAEYILDNRIDLSLNSVLGRYNRGLKEYGIFAVDEDLYEDVYYLLYENAFTNEYLDTEKFIFSKNTYSNFLELDIEEVNFTPIENSSIANVDILRDQILEDMKYKGVISLSESFLNKIKIVTNTNILESVKNKMDFESELYRINNHIDKAYLLIEEYNKMTKEINFELEINTILINESNNIRNLLKSSLMNSYLNEKSFIVQENLILKKELKKEIEGLTKKDKELFLFKKIDKDISKKNSGFLRNLKYMNNDEENIISRKLMAIENKEKLENIYTILKLSEEEGIKNKELIKVRKDIEKISNLFSNEKDDPSYEIKDKFNKKIIDIDTLISLLNDILGNLEKMAKNDGILIEKKENWRSSIEDIESSEIKTTFIGEYNSTADSIDDEKIDRFIEIIEIKKNNLEKMKDFLNSFQYNNHYIKDLSKEKLKFDIDEKINSVDELNKLLEKDIDFKLKFTSFKDYKNEGFLIEDNEFLDYLKRMGSIDKKDFNNSEKKEKVNNIFDSAKKNFEKDEDDRNIRDYIDEDSLNYINNYQVDIEESDFNIDFNNSSINKMSKDARKILKESSDLLSISKETFDDIFDSLLILEYCNFYFSNRIEDENNRFPGDPFENGEMEYILFGRDNFSSNINQVKASIFALRLSMNLAYAFTNSDLKMETLSLATAIASWSGFALPIIQSLILFTLALNESLLDIKALENGDYIPFIKNIYTWKSSINGILNQVSDLTIEFSNDIFYQLENYSIEKIDDIESSLYKYIDNTTRGSLDILVDSIVNPLIDRSKSIISNSTDLNISDVKFEIESVVSDMPDFVKNSFDYEDYSKYLFEIKNLDNPDIIFNKLETRIDSLRFEVNEKIFSNLTKESDKVKNKLGEIIKEKNENVNEKIKEVLSSYSEKLSTYGDVDIKGNYSELKGKSSIVFNYSDYLNILILFKLLDKDGERNLIENILKVLVMNLSYELDIRNTFTAFNLDVKASYNQVFTSDLIRNSKRLIEREKTYGY